MSQNPVTSQSGLTLDHASTDTQVSVRRGDVRWVVRSTWEQRLLGDDPLDWFNLDRETRATGIKTGFRRGVWRVELGDEIVVAKVVAAVANSGVARIRLALGQTASHREWRLCLEALRRGAPVVRPVALGQRGGSSPATVLITEEVKNARQLRTAWDDAGRDGVGIGESDPVVRQDRIAKLTHAVAGLYADAHKVGFVHLDGHPGNILLATEGDAGLVARFADTTDANLSHGHPPWVQIVRSLAHVDHYMKRVASRTQRLRFLREYLERLHAPHSYRHDIWMEHRMVPAILATEVVHAATLARQRDRRVTRDGKYFTRIALGGGWRATVVLALERRHVFPESETTDFNEPRWRELLDGIDNERDGIGTVRSRLARCGHSVQIGSAGGFLRALFWRAFGSSAWRMLFRCHALRHRDIPAPLVLGCLEHRTALGGVDRTLLIYTPSRRSFPGGSRLSS